MIAEDDPLFASPDPPELYLVFVTVETVTPSRPPSLFPSLPPLIKLEDVLEDSLPAALKPAPGPQEAAELPPPEDTAEEAPRVVMLMPPVPLLVPDPPELAAWELLDVVRTELPGLP